MCVPQGARLTDFRQITVIIPEADIPLGASGGGGVSMC